MMQKHPIKHIQLPTNPPIRFSLSDTTAFRLKKLQPGEHLCYQGRASQKLYIVQSGLLKSYVTKLNGQEFVLGFSLPSDLFGWEGIDSPRHAISVIALTKSTVCVITTDKMFQLTNDNPKLGNQLLRMISRRIHHDNIALLRTSAQQRVAIFLLQLTARYRELGFPADRCRLLMPHQDIANYLRINPSTISRVFNELQKQKLILIEKGTVYLQDIPRLRLLAEIATDSCKV